MLLDADIHSHGNLESWCWPVEDGRRRFGDERILRFVSASLVLLISDFVRVMLCYFQSRRL